MPDGTDFQCAGEVEQLSFEDGGVYDLDGENHYSVRSCVEVAPEDVADICNATFNTCGIKKNIGCLLQDAAVLNDASKIAIAPDAFIKSGFVVGSA
ncbi:hypothetical protein ACLB1Q_34845 [Escherichia coli]